MLSYDKKKGIVIMKYLSKTAARLCALLTCIAIAVMLVPTAIAAEYETAEATEFVFSDSSVTVKEGKYSGYKLSGTALSITAEGVYVLSGSCSDGSVTVKKGVTNVTLVLNGLELTSADTAPIACNKSSEVTITVVEGTTNTLTDSAFNNDDEYPENEDAENSVIKCKDGSRVTICGGGTLNINANGKNGIKSGATTEAEGEAWLTIKQTVLNVNAPVNDAIKSEATLNILSGKITVSAADDALHSDLILNIGEAGTDGPDINITSCYEGIEAAQLNIYSGNISLRAEDDCLNAANADLGNYAFEINIFGGRLDMYTTEGDGLDSNGDICISGGVVSVWTANSADNQPLDADGTITISGGTVIAAGASAGMGMNINAEQEYITFGGGFMGGMNGGHGFGFGGKTDGNGTFAQMLPNNKPGMMPGAGSALNITRGSKLAIKAADGSVLWEGEALCDTSFLLFSAAELMSSSTYTLYADEKSVATSEDDGSNAPQEPLPRETDMPIPPQTTAVPQATSTSNVWQMLFFALCGFAAGVLLTVLAFLLLKKKR